MMDNEPRTWGEMSDAEQGALLLALHRGSEIDFWSPGESEWIRCINSKHLLGNFGDSVAYRERPVIGSNGPSPANVPTCEDEGCPHFGRPHSHPGASTNRRDALEEAIRFVENRAETYDREHGSYDYTTGVTEYPGNGAEWMNEWEEIADGLRALTDKEPD